jgi:molecular chaperone GrpE (heat shock protein)
MFRRKGKRPENSPHATVEEVMFVRALIEDRNEAIDRRDSTIRALTRRLYEAEAHSDALLTVLTERARSRPSERPDRVQAMLAEAMSDVVRLACDWQMHHGTRTEDVSSQILSLLREKYRLSAIEETPVSINPDLHQVVEVVHASDGQSSVEVLSPGYRIGETVIQQALVKVVLGLRAVPGAGRDRGDSSPEGNL